MQKLSLSQIQSQRLSPQQIQFIKLLQVPTAELDKRVEEELEINPALEEGNNTESEADTETLNEESEEYEDDLSIEDYIDNDDIAGYKMQGDGANPDEEDKEMPLSFASTLHDGMITQLGYLKFNEKEDVIARQLIGSIEQDGYIRRELEAIVNDLAFTQGINTDEDEVESILFKIQQFDPPGVAARNLKECLIIQLERRELKDYDTLLALRILEEAFDEFSKKHYDKIIKKLGIDEDDLKDAIQTITKLDPKPGGSGQSSKTAQYLMPDFIVTVKNGDLDVQLNSKNAPDLRVSRAYNEMLQTYDKGNKKDKKIKEAASFVKQKLDAAKWFIDAIKQRQATLLSTMNAIVEYQRAFFLDGEETSLRPMILKDIAEKINMDISTISRVANSKSVQTEFGLFPLKYFFSEGIATDSGEDVSSREVKSKLKDIIENEDKAKPLSDEKIEKLLRKEGYNIARRTVAKYREQLDISVARLRKQL